MLGMIVTVVFGLMGLGQAAPSEVRAIRVEHVRPSRIFHILVYGKEMELSPKSKPRTAWKASDDARDETQGFLPTGLEFLRADDRESKLVAQGSKEALDMLSNFIATFDERRRKVRLSLRLRSPIDKLDSSYTAEVTNNSPWSMTEEEIGYSVSVASRINGDRSVTLFVSPTLRGGTRQLVIRVKDGERFVLADAGWTIKGEPSPATLLMRKLSATAELEWKGRGEPTPYLEIQATVSEPKVERERPNTPGRSR